MRACRRAERSSTSASRTSSAGTPSAAGEALQRLPATEADVLDLHRADLARRLLQRVEGRRQRMADDIGPGRARADDEMASRSRKCRAARQAVDVEHVFAKAAGCRAPDRNRCRRPGSATAPRQAERAPRRELWVSRNGSRNASRRRRPAKIIRMQMISSAARLSKRGLARRLRAQLDRRRRKRVDAAAASRPSFAGDGRSRRKERQHGRRGADRHRPAERFLPGRRAGGRRRRRDRAARSTSWSQRLRARHPDAGLASGRTIRASPRAIPASSPFETIEMPYGTQTLWPDHCIQGSRRRRFPSRTSTWTKAELIIRKGFRPAIDSYSAFFENDHTTPTGLAGYLRERGIRTVTLVGLATDFASPIRRSTRSAAASRPQSARRLPRHRPRRLARTMLAEMKASRREAARRLSTRSSVSAHPDIALHQRRIVAQRARRRPSRGCGRSR